MTTQTPGRRPLLRRHAATLLIGGVVVLAVTGSIILSGGDPARTEPHDPENSGPQGSQAVTRVLEQMGVPVTIARSAEELEALDLGVSSVVVVTSSDQLGEGTLDRLLKHAEEGRLVVVEPTSAVAEGLGASRPVAADPPVENVRGSCADARFDDLALDVDNAYTFSGQKGCFLREGRAVLQQRDTVTVFGAGDALTNDQILRGDNAAIVLRLLGQGNDLVWYVPRIQDVAASDELEPSFLPPWIVPGLWLLSATTIALVVWRARRLGPLAVEPLPVIVKAIETTESRGRLYRKAGDRQHAANVLRAAARSRAAARLGVRPGDAEAIVRDAARAADRPAPEVENLIGDKTDPPKTDRDLIALANALTELDRRGRTP